jgi:hypothetical protein
MDEDLEFQLLEHAIKLRGVLLEATIEVERKMDRFLSNHFCANIERGNELLEFLWMTERITLGAKKEILFYVLDNNYKQFLKNNEEFKTLFENLIPHRNIFAHLEIDRNYADYNGTYQVKFKKYSKGKLETKKYGRIEMEKITIDFERLNHFLDLLVTSNAP